MDVISFIMNRKVIYSIKTESKLNEPEQATTLTTGAISC